MKPDGLVATGFCSRAVASLAAALVFCASPVSALSDLEIREKRSAEINSIKKTECAGEAPAVLKLVEYAAALVFHNELEEAKSFLSSAMAQAESPSCKEGLSRAIAGL